MRRILRLKASLGLTSVDAAVVDASRIDPTVGTPERLAAAAAVTDRTTTVIRDVPRRIPMAGLDGSRALVTGWGQTATAELADSLRSRGADVTVVETGIDPDAAAIASAVGAAAGMNVVIATTYDVSVHGKQTALVDALMAAGAPVLVAAVGTPYDIAKFPDVPTFVATYSFQPVAMESLVRVLAGEIMPAGRLPVEIPAAGQGATVLYPFGWQGGLPREVGLAPDRPRRP